MNAATKAIAAQGLARRAFSLGAVKAFDHALQFLLPVVLVDFLPTIEERIPLQAYATISVALARAVLVAGGAWFTSDMSVILWLLLATVLLKLALLLAYIGRFHGWGKPWFKATVFSGQIR